MKKITPITMWSNGTTTKATILDAYAVNVTLGTSATFYYALLDDNKQPLASGNLTMSGEQYQAWDADATAWDFIAKELNLEILGDYVEPQKVEEI